MEKYQPQTLITPKLLKNNPDIYYVIPSGIKNGIAAYNINFAKFQKYNNILYLHIINDINLNDVKYFCDIKNNKVYDNPEEYESFSGSGYGMLNTALDSVIFTIKYNKKILYYIEDIEKFNIKFCINNGSKNVCLDCCHISKYVKSRLESELGNIDNAIFLWPKAD